MDFEWDESKNRTNIEKHGFSFARAATIFAGPILTAVDDRFEYGERREISIGVMEGFVIITVVHTDRNGRRRIISARRAKTSERIRYEREIQRRTEGE